MAASAGDVDATIRKSFTFFLDLSVEERHALRTLAAWRQKPARRGGTTS
jgi:hypothetical protein